MNSTLDELQGLLVEGQDVSKTLLARIEASADLVELVTLLESLALVDERRAQLLDQLRKAASVRRRRDEERSIRQFILRALEQIGVPQTTGFLEDYLWATELVEAKSSGLGSLRRDEYRAWTRRGNQPRVAYIVPCLDPTGAPVPRWLSRSDWPLTQRIAVEGAEELWALHRLRALLEAYETTAAEARSRFAPIISQWAQEALGAAEADSSVPARPAHELDSDELSSLVGDVKRRLQSLGSEVRQRQERAAAAISGDEEQLLWGVRK